MSDPTAVTGERRPRRSLATAIAALDRNERLAAIGALVVAASMFLPWYRFPFNHDLVKTGFGAFNLALAALLLTVAAAMTLTLERAWGRPVPRPMHEGTLLLVAGVWAAALVLYAGVDRPTVARGGFDHAYGLAYGLAVALGGAVVLALAGLRHRAEELHREPAASA